MILKDNIIMNIIKKVVLLRVLVTEKYACLTFSGVEGIIR